METTSDVVVVGAGLAGLTCTQLVRRAGLTVTVIDAHPGGRARSDVQGGYAFNRGAHALYLGGATERVLKQLGINYQGGRPQLADGHMVANGQLLPLAFTATLIARSKYLGTKDKLALGKLFALLPRTKSSQFASISVAEWLQDLPPKAAEVARMAIRTSTYSTQFDVMSADIAVSGLKGSGVLYIDGGWQHLVDSLRADIPNSGLVNEAVIAVNDDTSSGRVTATTATSTYVARALVVATGSPAAAFRLLGQPNRPEVGPPVEAACLDLGLNRLPVSPFVLGLHEPLYFSLHSPPASLAPKGHFVAHAVRYLDLTATSEPNQQRQELEQHTSLAGVASSNIVESRYLHRMTVSSSLPTVDTGGMAGRPASQASRSVAVSDRIHFAGDWVGPEGNLADASFASAAQAATTICQALQP
jgi:phytoene dehydrogenase-like protein